MNICIIGAGNVGATLARKLVGAGHAVRIANSRGPESLREVAAHTGAAAMTVREATHGVDAVILSVPFGSVPLLRWLLSELPKEVVIADTSNYFPYRDGAIAAVDGGEVESLWVSEQIGRPVIKAWNNALAATLIEKGLPPGSDGRIALSVAGDDSAQVKLVMSLVNDTGFDPVDGGSLSGSWRQQPITRAYCTELNAAELQAALATANRQTASIQREAILQRLSSFGANITTADVVRIIRELGA